MFIGVKHTLIADATNVTITYDMNLDVRTTPPLPSEKYNVIVNLTVNENTGMKYDINSTLFVNTNITLKQTIDMNLSIVSYIPRIDFDTTSNLTVAITPPLPSQKYSVINTLNVDMGLDIRKLNFTTTMTLNAQVTWLYVQPTTTTTTTTTTTSTGTPPTTTTVVNGTTTTTTIEPGLYTFMYKVTYDPIVVIQYPLYGMTYVYIEPNSEVYGTYQYVCSGYAGCGYCSYVQVIAWTEEGYNHLYLYIYDVRTHTTIAEYSTVISSDIAKVEVYHANLTNYIGVGYHWRIHVYDNDTQVYETGTFWFAGENWFNQDGYTPYPINVTVMYNTENDIGKITIERGATAEFCPFNDPVSCGMWYFWNWLSSYVYNMLPEPVKMLINAIGYFFDMLASILTWLTNPEVMRILSITLGIYLFGGSIVTLLEKGPVGFMDFWRFNFELMKKLFDLIVKAVTLIIPFK